MQFSSFFSLFFLIQNKLKIDNENFINIGGLCDKSCKKTNVMLFHSKFYYFYQFIVKNYKCPDLIAILLKKIFLSFFCKLLQANMMIGCTAMTKMQRPLIFMKFSLSILSLFSIGGIKEK
jgi:hypothetical protein